jgi:microcystin-dependent protein
MTSLESKMTDKTPKKTAETPMNKSTALSTKTTIKKIREYGPLDKAVSQADALKERFKAGSIPLESDFSDLIDLAAAPQIVPGTIIMFYGDKIPDGWALCDGGNGTPDLRGKFIKGGVSVIDNKNGGNGTISYTPSGTVEVKSHILNIDEIPPHRHYIDHKYINGSGAGYYPNMTAGSREQITETEHISKTGGGGGHSHKATFTGAPDSISIEPPYFTLCFIMKK